MIQAENLSKSYCGVLLFDHVSFTLQKGEKCALVGRNGSGKTTLLKILKGEESFDSGSLCTPKGYKLGFLDQHTHFQAPTVWEEALRGLPDSKPPYEVESILFGLGFDDSLLQQPPSTLSGGYHLRLKLAKVLAEEPNCLLLDEPTNYLDILSLRWLERYLKNWKGECLLISHDRDFLNALATHTMGIHRKTLKKVSGGLEKFYEKVLEEEEVYEKTRQNMEKKKSHLEDYIRRFGAKASKASQAQSKAKALEKMPSLAKLAALENLSFEFAYTPFSGKKMIVLDHISYSYEGKSSLIQDVSLELMHGKKVAIIGKNGAGKSTLLKLIAGDLAPLQGSYSRVDSVKMGTFGQTHISTLDLEKTVEEEILSASPSLTYSAARAICGQMMFSQDSAKKKISLLSGGERSRVLLGKILATPSNVLLLDEPTHHLDLESIEGLMQAIDAYEGSVVLVTHSEWMLERMNPDLLIIFEEGKQRAFLGNYPEFLEKEGWKTQTSSPKVKSPPPPRPPSRKPLEKEIARLEQSIETKEIALKDIEEKLSAAYEKGSPSEALELSAKIPLLQKELEELYVQLEEKYNHLENQFCS